jgi:hypothetical protein
LLKAPFLSFKIVSIWKFKIRLGKEWGVLEDGIGSET